MDCTGSPYAIRPRMVPALGLLIAALFLLLHPYFGLIHDARLYTLQALNDLQPQLYGGDVFLKFGSQDAYTVFTPLYSAAMAWLGAEPAASLITLFSAVAVLGAGWWLARTMAPPAFAWLGLGVLVLVPGFYGSDLTFAVLEGFVTPRMLAEALVLLSFCAWLRERILPCALLLLAALMVHPIMAFPGVLVVAAGWYLPRWRNLWPLPAAGILLAVAALAGWLPLERWQFDQPWWRMASWAPHLVLGKWMLADWARAATSLATLAIAATCLPDAGRRLATATLLTCAATLLLSWVGGDLLRIVLVLQGQAWRSLWIVAAVAALVLPWVVARCWTRAPLQRCGALLLVAAWVAGAQSLALAFSIPALLAVACAGMRVPDRFARFAPQAAAILLAVLVLCMLAFTWTGTGSAVSDGSWLGLLRYWSEDRLLPTLVLLGAWYAAVRFSSPTGTGVLTLLTALLAASAVGATAREWGSEAYPREARQSFASWRALIPPGSDVLWATRLFSGSDPTGVWLLLERPSFYSAVQTNSGLFSRAAAVELAQRKAAVPLGLPTEQSIRIDYMDSRSAHVACDAIPVRYIVTDLTILGSTMLPAPQAAPPPFDQLNLHICP